MAVEHTYRRAYLGYVALVTLCGVLALATAFTLRWPWWSGPVLSMALWWPSYVAVGRPLALLADGEEDREAKRDRLAELVRAGALGGPEDGERKPTK